MNIKRYKKEGLLIVIILLISGALLLANRIIFSKPANQVEISVNGEVVRILDLDQDADILIQGYGDGTNRFVIQDGKVHVSEATCPDKLCMHQGWVQITGESLVCLPNRVMARIIGE